MEEKTNNMSNLVQISEIDKEIYVNLNCIRAIEKIDHHPGTNETNGFPKYQIFLKDCFWTWVLITIEEFNKFIKPFILSKNKIELN